MKNKLISTELRDMFLYLHLNLNPITIYMRINVYTLACVGKEN